MNDTRFETGRKFILRNKFDYLIEKESKIGVDIQKKKS